MHGSEMLKHKYFDQKFPRAISICIILLLSYIVSYALFTSAIGNFFVLLDNWNRHGNILRWRHNECDGVFYHQPHDCLLSRLFRRKSKKTSKLRASGLCVGNSPMTGEFPAQRASDAENVSIWWRHHGWMFFAYFFLQWPMILRQFVSKRPMNSC